MSFWNDLKREVGRLTDEAGKQVAKFKDASFADASMAMCALIAAADGSIDTAERNKTAAFIGINPVLQVFDVSKLQEKFNYFCRKLTEDFAFGKMEAMQTIGKLAGNTAKATTLIQVGIIIGGADGDFDPDEKQVVREVCTALGIDHSVFDLKDDRPTQGQHKTQEGAKDDGLADWMR